MDWQPLPVAPLPLPSLLTAMGRIFVGREEQTSVLLGLWKDAAAGERRVALVAGEPGVGKTRLAAELATAVHEEGAIVLAGRCDEDMGVPYQPFVEALRHFVDHAPELSLGRYGGELARLVPELTGVADLPPPIESDPETERYRLFDAVAAWLSAASVDRPLLFVLDDLQWAAKPTLLLLRHIVRSSDPKRVFVLGTYRDTELGHDLVEVLADLRRQAGVERMSLSGLDSSGVAAFMEEAAGRALREEDVLLARAVHEETEGNPFFVREVFRHLVETGAIEDREGRWTTRLPVEELGIPESILDVVGRRLSRLSPETNETLRMAAVAGPEFEVPVLQAAGNLDEEPLLSALEEATEARLVIESPGPRYRFTHALVRVTLYADLAAARRVALHRRVAEAIEVVHGTHLDDYLPALAHHFGRASAPATDAKAIAYAKRAGDRALNQLAHDEAASYYSQALALVDVVEGRGDEAERLELLISLGEAQRRGGDPSHRETLLDAARLAQRRGDVDALARAALANNRGAWYSVAGELDTERIAVLESALEVVSGSDNAIRARLMANLAVELVFSPDRDHRVALSDGALGIARQLGDPALLAEVLGARYYTILAPGNLFQRLAETAELVNVAQRLDDPLIKNRASWFRYRAALEAGDVDEAEQHLALVARFTTILGQPWLRWTLGFAQTGIALLRGRLKEAERLAAETLETGRGAGDPEANFIFALERFQVSLDEGRPDEVERLLAGLRPQGTPQSLLASMFVLLHCQGGRREDARRRLDREVRTAFADVPVNNTWLLTLTNWASVSATLDEVGAAEILFDVLTPYAEQVPLFAGVANGAVALYLGMLATTLRRYDQAESYFSSAAAFHDRIRAPVWLAHTGLEWGRMLLTRSRPEDADRARDLLAQALATARALGLANVERRVVELLS